jgi:hypothetical protein
MSNLSLRTEAVSNNAHHLLDPIMLDLMKDPVIAADGNTYDRDSIQNWFDTTKTNGRGLRSPLTNLPMSSEALRPNEALKRELLIFITSKESSIPAPDIKFTLSSDIYKELDRISELSLLEQLNLKPPKIVVIGNESHGKSTLLERIIGLPLFPKDKGLCTRCVVRVHLRRSAPNVPSIAEITVRNTASFYNVNGRQVQQLYSPVFPTVFAALDNIREKIQTTMDQLVRNDPHKRVVIDDKEIVVKINLPYCLNVDILDVPGLITLSPENATQNLPEVTQNLALKIVKEEQESAIFLLVNDIRVPLNQSKGCAIIQQAKVEKQTLGIFTKVDTYVSEDGDETEEIAHLLEGRNPSFFRVGYGWMTASSKKPSKHTSIQHQQGPIELSVLCQMTKTETELFHTKFSGLSAEFLGIDNIRQKVQKLYENFIKTHWTPVLSRKLSEHRTRLIQDMNELGALLPKDPAYVPFVEALQPHNVVIQFFTDRYLQSLITSLFTSIIKHAEEIWICLYSDTDFWKMVENYKLSMQCDGVHLHKCYHRFSGCLANFPKMVDAPDFFKTREGIEKTLRESLTEMAQNLKDKLQPSAQSIEWIVDALCTSAFDRSNFKLIRFSTVITGLKRIVSQRLTQAQRSFNIWHENFMSTRLASPLVIPEYLRYDNKVSCYLQLNDNIEFERFPHLIMEKFYEVLATQFSTLEITDFREEEFTNLVENCRDKRLNFLRLISNVVEVEAAIDVFARRVRVIVRDQSLDSLMETV